MGAEEWRNHLMKVFNKMRETDKSALKRLKSKK